MQIGFSSEVHYMAKSSREQIEADEIKILQELRKNSRLSYNDLAEKCGFSRQKVWRIVNDLEKNKTIWGYSTVIDDEKLGVKQFFILIKRKGGYLSDVQLDIAANGDTNNQLAKFGLIAEASSYTNGIYDWIVIVSAKDIREVKQFIERLRVEYHDVISDIQILETLFPLEKEGIYNPQRGKIKEYF